MISGIDPDMVRLAKRLKLRPILPTLPDRLALARAQQLDYVAFLTVLFADEVQRRDQLSIERRLSQAGLEDQVALEQFDWTASIQVDRHQLGALGRSHRKGMSRTAGSIRNSVDTGFRYVATPR